MYVFIESTSKKAFVFIIKRLVENKLYYPVHTEMITEISQWNYWFIIGWYVYIRWFVILFNNIIIMYCFKIIYFLGLVAL